MSSNHFPVSFPNSLIKLVGFSTNGGSPSRVSGMFHFRISSAISISPLELCSEQDEEFSSNVCVDAGFLKPWPRR